MDRLKVVFALMVVFAAAVSQTRSAEPEATGRIERRGNEFVASRYLDEHEKGRELSRTMETGILNGFGEADFKVTIPKTGWYELWLEAGGSDAALEIDGRFVTWIHGQQKTWEPRGKAHKALNLHLDAGERLITFAHPAPFGLPSIHRFYLQPSEDVTGKVHLEPVADHLVFRRGEALEMDLKAGRAGQPYRLTFTVVDARAEEGSKPVARWEQEIAAGEGVFTRRVEVPTNRDGTFDLRVSDESGRPVARTTQFEVIDTQSPPDWPQTLEKQLVQEIDCAQQVPDYSVGETRVVRSPLGAYRESGDKGVFAVAMDAGSFTYTLDLPAIQEPYVVEVEYPDDDERTFTIGLIERAANLGRAPTVGVASGGIYSLSNQLQPHVLYFFPRQKDPRLIFQNWWPGQRAAAARIRVYRITSGFPALNPTPGGRKFGTWQEEPMRAPHHFGAAPTGDEWFNHRIPVAREALLSNYTGANLLEPTIAVYQAKLWPSRHLPTFNMDAADLIGPRSTKDPLPKDQFRLILLEAECHRISVLGQLFMTPQKNLSKYLSYRFGGDGDLDKAQDFRVSPWLVAHRNGAPPHYAGMLNPLHPGVQQWMADLVGELADRYKDSPAFDGLSLRVMGWQFLGWQTFASINFGYGDLTVGLFEKETGIDVPVDDDAADRFKQRYQWLMANAYDQWVDWRCRKMYDYHARLAKILTDARPDLKLYLDVEGPNFTNDITLEDWRRKGWTGLIRETGLDPARYRENAAIVLNDRRHYPPAIRSYRLGPIYAAQRRQAFFDPTPVEQAAKPQSAGTVSAIRMDAQSMETNMIKYADIGMKRGMFRNSETIHGAGVLNGAGRHALMRYANAMADGNIVWMTDGSHGQAVGQPQFTREFLREYRALPAIGMTRLEGSGDPVALWYGRDNGRTWFYLVNRVDYAVDAAVGFDGSATLRRLTQDETTAIGPDERLRLSLMPYQIIAFIIEGGQVPVSLDVNVPEAVLPRLREQVAFVRKLIEGDPANTELALAPISPVDLRRAARKLGSIEEAIEQGRFWSAWVGLLSPELQKVYEAFGAEPPGLFHRKTPAAPTGALLPEQMQQMASQPARVADAGELDPRLAGVPVLTWNGGELPLGFETPVLGRYRLRYAMAGASLPADLRLAVDQRPIEPPATPPSRGPGWLKQVLLRPVVLTPGRHQLSFRSDSGQGGEPGLLWLQIEPACRNLAASDWLAAGPFPGAGQRRLEPVAEVLTRPLPPEQAAGVSASSAAQGEPAVRWTRLQGGDLFVDLSTIAPGDTGAVGYAMTDIHSPTQRQAELLFGVDYWARVWLNGQVIFEPGDRPARVAPRPGEFVIPVTLQEGVNRLLVKVHAGGAGFGFWMSLTDPGDLRYAVSL
jgi:hypothetical protein